MKAIYHYRGLPYSVLLDKQGRIVERIFGFGGDGEFQHLRKPSRKRSMRHCCCSLASSPQAIGPRMAAIPAAHASRRSRKSTRGNVAKLQVAWTYHTGIPDMSSMSHRPPALEVTPIVVTGRCT